MFDKEIEQYLGFRNIASKSFESVVFHVYFLYCACLLLQDIPPGVSSKAGTILEKQRDVDNILQNREKARILQMLTRIGGLEASENESKKALAAA